MVAVPRARIRREALEPDDEVLKVLDEVARALRENNERANWADILEPHGWTWVKRIGEEDFWRRPGKDVGISATTNYEGSDCLYVFSTSTPFEARVGVSKFTAKTILEHQGNFSASQNGLLVYYSGGAGLNSQLTWFDRGGKPLGTVGAPGSFVGPAVSPDGNTVAVVDR